VNPNTEDLDSIYWTADEWDRVSRRMVKYVLEEVKRGPEVALVSYGSPTLFDDIGRELQRRLKRAKKRCVALPAVSCLDTLSIDLGIDYGDGLQVLDATDLIESKITLNARLHTLLLQIYEFGTSTTPDAIENRPGRFAPLVAYLEQFYPDKHRIVLAFSDNGDGDGQRLIRTRLSALDSKSSLMFPGMTLYLPPLP
jgi:precorrin-3B methylase